MIAVTPEAADDLRRRHPGARIVEIPNGFEPELLEKRTAVERHDDHPLGHADEGSPARPAPAGPEAAAPARPARLRRAGDLGRDRGVRRRCRDRPALGLGRRGRANRRGRRRADHSVPRRRRRDRCGGEGLRVPGPRQAGAVRIRRRRNGSTPAPSRRRSALRPTRRRGLDHRGAGRIGTGELPAPVPSQRLAPHERPRLAEQLAKALSTI